jgi:hypothetical protein
MVHEPRCGHPLCMTLSVVQVKQNVLEAGSGFSNRKSLFLKIVAGCVYIFVTTSEDGRKGTVKRTLVQALRLCTGRTTHRESRGIALL